MNKREMLIQKIENEYKTFIDNLKKKSFEEIVENAEQIANMKLVKNYISRGLIVNEENIDFLLVKNNPLEIICDNYEQSSDDIITGLEEAISEAEYYESDFEGLQQNNAWDMDESEDEDFELE